MEFECIWREHERTKIPRCILTDMLSDKINVLKDFIADELWKSSPELRTKASLACRRTRIHLSLHFSTTMTTTSLSLSHTCLPASILG